jgi:NADH dehydrogenase
MKILVCGGTGFIGRHVVDELLARHPKDEIAVLTRDPARPLPWGAKVRAVGGDVTEPTCLPHATRGIDCVVHCVQFPGHPVENPWKGWTYLRVDGQGTANVVEAAKRNGVKRFVYFSGAGTAPGKTQPWFRAKLMAEAAIRDSGIPFVILRPSWVYGPEDRSMNKFIAFVRGATPPFLFIPLIGDGAGRVQPVSVFDVAKVAAMAVSKEEATGKALELGGPEALSMREIVETLRRMLGSWRPVIPHPVPLMKMGMGGLSAACWTAGLLTGGAFAPTPVLSPAAIDFVLMEEPVDPRPAEALFGMSFERFEDGLRRYLKP